MDSILSGLKLFFDTFGSTILLPIIIIILALVLGAKFGRAFRAGITVGIAFIGIGLVTGLMGTVLTNVGQALTNNLGIQRDIFDVGWPAAASIAFGTNVGLAVIPIALIVNIVFLALRLTKTLNVDVWNYWHFAFLGSLVSIATKNVVYGFIAAAIAAALALFLGDWTAKAVQRFYNVPGISIPHLTAAPGVPFAILVNWVFEKIPGLRDLKADPESIRKKWGLFGEPVVMGFIIGAVLGILAYAFKIPEGKTTLKVIADILGVAMNLAAVMLLLPRMVSILMEGLIPVSEAANEFMQKRANGREIYIGLDAAILTGHPAAISTALVLVPIAILLSIILPGNRVILFADLAVIPFVVALMAPVMKGNIVRMIVAGILELGVGFYIATAMSPFFTAAAVESGFSLPENATKITSIADGFLWPNLLFTKLTQWLGGPIGLVVLAAIVGALIFLFSKNTKKWEEIAGAPKEEVSEE
ncbi:MAG TPA: PTS transporter subunit IIC [Anaerolineaceae bacterium]|nr:PTS transporter subunit IIC [Anaerolineaceae bacterium]HPT23804.1 PTS transporter subunit IIC [Anaerolineaceae bacterium]